MKANSADPNSSRCCSIYRTSFLRIIFVASCCILQVRIAASFTPYISKSHASIPMSVSVRPESQSSTRFQATAIDSPSGSMSDFQQRMKKLVQTNTKPKTLSKNMPKNMQTVETLEEFKKVICSNKDDKLIVVRFYAPWCKACKAIAPAFYRLASLYTDALFIDVPVTPDNANLHQGLGVPSLRFAHIYHPTGGLVEELKISKKHFANFARSLKFYVQGGCSIEEAPDILEP